MTFLDVVRFLLNLLWAIVSILMILVILMQRGRGGGLAGALGGMGGSSAFGTRAGDVFTRITVGFFVVWLLLAMILVGLMSKDEVAALPSDEQVQERLEAEKSLKATEPGPGIDPPKFDVSLPEVDSATPAPPAEGAEEVPEPPASVDDSVPDPPEPAETATPPTESTEKAEPEAAPEPAPAAPAEAPPETASETPSEPSQADEPEAEAPKE